MNQELELQLQAYLDGELSGTDKARVAALLEKDPAAQALYAELQQMSAFLKGNEPELRVPETREFYWSKIEREITRLESREESTAAPWWVAWIRNHLGAVSGLGVATALLLVAAFQLNWVAPGLFEEIDNPLESSSSFSFRSESQKMTVVWISNGDAEAGDDEEAVSPEEIPQ